MSTTSDLTGPSNAGTSADVNVPTGMPKSIKSWDVLPTHLGSTVNRIPGNDHCCANGSYPQGWGKNQKGAPGKGRSSRQFVPGPRQQWHSFARGRSDDSLPQSPRIFSPRMDACRVPCKASRVDPTTRNVLDTPSHGKPIAGLYKISPSIFTHLAGLRSPRCVRHSTTP